MIVTVAVAAVVGCARRTAGILVIITSCINVGCMFIPVGVRPAAAVGPDTGSRSSNVAAACCSAATAAAAAMTLALATAAAAAAAATTTTTTTTTGGGHSRVLALCCRFVIVLIHIT